MEAWMLREDPCSTGCTGKPPWSAFIDSGMDLNADLFHSGSNVSKTSIHCSWIWKVISRLVEFSLIYNPLHLLMTLLIMHKILPAHILMYSLNFQSRLLNWKSLWPAILTLWVSLVLSLFLWVIVSFNYKIISAIVTSEPLCSFFISS